MRRQPLLALLLLSASLLVTLSVVQAQRQPPATPDAAPRRLKVLFLGDQGHHQPLERCRQAYSAMALRGVDFTYTDRTSDLNPETLNRFDALLLYANIEHVTPGQEKALLDYVAAGHGFAPIHCASFCFLDSPALTALTGARFKSHGTGTFRETQVAAQKDHPVLKGLAPIESWDESYVHEMHNEKDRTVLAERVESGRAEPYTWVRTHGAGRVFYTAWGHDQRTWGNKNFLDLLERGLRWSAGDWALAPQPKLKAFEYADANIPNYPAGKQWGTTSTPFNKVQLPVSPEESMRHLVVPPGFEVKLFASDPDIKKPICMAWDARGRLWVAETFDYPNDMQPEGKGRDRITICEDTDGDGRADKFTVFADKLSIPTSLCFANGGVLVTQAPDMLFLKDTDGDDKADQRKVLFTGWGTADTHAGPSNMRYGFDNWVYGAVGYSGFRGTVGGQAVSFGQGLWRMKPDGSKLEFLASSNNNTWGLGLSEDGHVLASTANGNPSFYLHIPNRYYEQVQGFSPKVLDTIADSPRYFPVVEQIKVVDHHGGYTAGAGHALYTARSFPREYWNGMAFVSEPTGHLVGQFRISPDGSGFKARDEFSVLASDDEWFAPIAADVGPDGSLWVLDWYNIIVQHNPIPPGFEKGKGNAYVTPLRDKRHGRVYRMVWKSGKPSAAPDLSKATPARLVEALKSDNQLWRMHAQRLLVEGKNREVLPALLALAADTSVDETGLNAAAVHALWAAQGLGAFDGEGDGAALSAATAALSHPAAGVRKAAVDVLPRTAGAATVVMDRKLLADPDARVRKAALLALSEMPASDAAGAAAFAALSSKDGSADRGLSDAATIAAARHDAGFLKAAFAAFPSRAGAAPSTSTPSPAVNVLPNPSFEEGQNQKPQAWAVRTYGGRATHDWAEGGRTGARCLRVRSESGSDTSWFVDAPVEPQTDYRLSAWVKTEGLSGAMGALLNVHGTEFRTNAVNGTSDGWKRVEVTFNSGDRSTVSINCLFGGWGASRGTALFDDVELVRAAAPALPGPLGRAVTVVTGNYARRAPVDSVVATLSTLKNTDARLAQAAVQGLADGWPEGQDAAPRLTDSNVADLKALMTSLPSEARERLASLAARWGRGDVFAEQVATLWADLVKQLSAPATPAEQRVLTARRLVALDGGPAAVGAVLDQLTPAAPPGAQSGLIEALAASRDPASGKAVVAKWPSFTPTAQRAAVALLLRKPDWTSALLDGIDAGTVNARDLRAEHWQVLKASPEAKISARAAALEQAKGREPNADKKKVLDALAPLAQRTGDVAAGRAAFERNCAVCHTIEGAGGKVGPDLTGIGARPKPDLLAEVVDPNRSVEGTYRQWIVQTKDEVTSGRLLSESRTSIELIDAAGKTHVIDRADIKRLKASELSVMPEGFEQLPAEDLAGILEFLATSKVKR